MGGEWAVGNDRNLLNFAPVCEELCMNGKNDVFKSPSYVDV